MESAASSSIALEAYLEEGDARFLAEVLRSTNAKGLGALAPRWYRDRRPELRRMLLEYVDDGLERPHHQPLIKRLYKLAEGAKDHECLAHFLVSFDRLARRELKTRQRWDWQAQEMVSSERVIHDPKIPRGRAPTARRKPEGSRAPEPPTIYVRDPYTGKQRAKKLEHLATFTYLTRRYLQRRCWRWFRLLGARDPAAYREAIVTALQLYRDEHLQTAMSLLDAWGLVHVLYHHSPLLVQDRSGWTLAEGTALSDLRPAPAFPAVWKEAPAPLFDLLVRAKARVVRMFALATLRGEHAAALQGVDIQELRRLLASPHEEVQMFAAELLRSARGLEKLSVDDWRALLRAANAFTVPVLAEQFAKNVLPERVTTDGCLELACASAAPVARLGFAWLKARPVASGDDLARLVKLGGAEADVVRGEAVTWLVDVLARSPFTTALHVRELLDARHLDVRTKGLALVLADVRFRGEPLLWGAMSETPYDDVRAALVAHLALMKGELEAGALRHLWASVLLAVHRGSRAKLGAARQVAERIVRRPEEADQLLPLLAILLRSLRTTERRAALAALGRAAYFARELRTAIGRHLPALRLFPAELTVAAPALPAAAPARPERPALEEGAS